MIFRTLFAFFLLASALQAGILPSQVAVVYNSTDKNSKNLADFYALNRKIPQSNLIGIKINPFPTISRSSYENQIRQPLVKHFTEQNWWKLGEVGGGITQPISCKIKCIVIMKGIPLRINRCPVPEAEQNKKRQFKKNNEASVDSELSLMGVESYPIGGIQPNPFFKKNLPASNNPANFMILVGRIDAHTFEHCQRMILDAIDTEKTGLWGRSYIDHAIKGGGYDLGDKWISNVAKMTQTLGHPTIIDRQNNTFFTNYPMTEAALYFGWYAHNRNGPFVNPNMKFNKGAIAVHLHSYSASQLTNPTKNWSAGLIDRGAAATLGNTWEPFLSMSHNFDAFYNSLLRGYTLIEAGYHSIPCLSWQGVVLGDPLYTPYKTKSPDKKDLRTDRSYKTMRLATLKFNDPQERFDNLLKVATRKKDPTILEALGYQLLEKQENEKAAKLFKLAKKYFKQPTDQLRQDLNLVELHRRNRDKSAALKILTRAKKNYQNLPEAKSITGLITRLNPPAPKPTKPSKK